VATTSTSQTRRIRHPDVSRTELALVIIEDNKDVVVSNMTLLSHHTLLKSAV
jgi:hypothetical protein